MTEEQEIEEDLLELEAASLPRRPTVGRPQFSLESLLSPDEAMQYAQLLSVEAEEERRSRLAEQSAELDFDLEQLLAQDEAEHDLRRSDESPVISEHDYEDFFENTRSVTIGSTTRSPHLSPDLRSRGSTSSFNRLDDGQISATMDDDSHFPSLSTSPLRTSGASPSPPECTPASAASPWSAVLRRPMASPSSSAAASHGSPGPFCTPSRPLTHSQEDEDEEDADLKLAIQLSLLETSGGT